MSYKKCLEGMIGQAAQDYLEALALKHRALGPDDVVMFYESVEIMPNDIPLENSYTWECVIPIYVAGSGLHAIKVYVGGTVDPDFGILCSSIRRENGSIIWLDVPESRQAYGITEFKIK